MKIKCVKTSIDIVNKEVTNGDMSEYLVINTVFWVFGIRFFQNVTYMYIFNGNHLFEVPLELFEIVDSKVSNGWKFKVWENGEITLWPELFYQEHFLENFADREPYERLLFNDLRLMTEQ